MPDPIKEFNVPNTAALETSTSRTYTESSTPKQRTAKMPAVMEIMTKEMAECVKMNRNPCCRDWSTELAAVAAACRCMASDITMAAEKKKLKLSSRKQEFAPTHS